MKAAIRLPSLASRDRRALLLGAAVVLPVFFASFVVLPWMHRVTARRAAVERERTLLARERALVASAPHDRVLLAEARRALDAAAPRLFDGSEAVTASAELARYVGALATDNALVLDRSESVLDDRGSASDAAGSRSHVRADSLDRPLRVAIQAHGDAQSIVDFLRAGESGPRDIRFERIDITRGRDANRPESSTGALTITATVTGLARFAVLGTPALAVAPGGATRKVNGGGEP